MIKTINKPLVAIVGRPNVGKSTLFNRLMGRSMAIVDDQPGITRDRLYGDCDWAGRDFVLIDTGGLEGEVSDSLKGRVKEQIELAIAEADLILLLVDAIDGLVADDVEAASLLRSSGKEILLVVNKAEGERFELGKYDFYSLGLGEPFPISAIQGIATGDLLDEIVERLPEVEAEEKEREAIKIAVVGRPNVGKSSLVNKILGEERVIVHSSPGTTRDTIDTYLSRDGREFILIDTAGIRRRKRVEEGVEKYGVNRSLRAIERSDIALLMIDATEGATDQDQQIARFIDESGKGCIILANKWDLVDKDSYTAIYYEKQIAEKFNFLNSSPIVFISALTGQRVVKILPLVEAVAEERARRISTGTLNDFITKVVARRPPPVRRRGKRVKIYYATQASVNPPTIILFVNDPELLTEPYKRYLINRLRETYGFIGTPIRLVARKSKGRA